MNGEPCRAQPLMQCDASQGLGALCCLWGVTWVLLPYTSVNRGSDWENTEVVGGCVVAVTSSLSRVVVCCVYIFMCTFTLVVTHWQAVECVLNH